MIALRLARKVPGVIQVNDELTYETDDSKIKVELSMRDVDVLDPYTAGRRGGAA